MHRGQPDSGCPKAVYFPACGKPGRAPAGKEAGTRLFAYLKGIRLTKGRGELLFRYVENGRGTASGRRQGCWRECWIWIWERGSDQEPAI